MFTGIIECTGKVAGTRATTAGLRIAIQPGFPASDVRVGDSVAVNGACLTAAAVGSNAVEFDVVPETLSESNLGQLRTGSRVNLERSLRLGDRIGGHLVTGHVDGLASVVEPASPGGGLLRLRYPRELSSMIAEKGSVAVEGVSLTVASVGGDVFSVAVIPLTLEATTLGRVRAGRDLNLEVDILARYVARQIGREQGKGGRVTEEWMRNEGYV